ncbi:MAG TPA: hypothetical protein VHX37_03020 [Acidobacteriaceae bacterium]|nr:hypothetical protein [Acidobacteriaceae bacterium]
MVAGILPSASFAQTPALPAGSSHYTLIQASDGKTVGSADATVQTLPNGYQVTSHGEMKMAKFTYTFNNDNRLDSQLDIVHDQLTGTVNGAQVTFNLSSDASGREFQINIAAQGKNTSNSVDRHQHTVLLPDLDPAAYIEMAHFALEHPATPWIVIPKQNGLLIPAQYTMQNDIKADFHGQSIFVRHTSVIVSGENGISIEIYSTGDGQLLEADLPEQNFYVIHDGFKLDSRPHYTPPRGSAPPANQPGQQPDSGQPPPQSR